MKGRTYLLKSLYHDNLRRLLIPSHRHRGTSVSDTLRLRRLRRKEEEWKRSQREWNKVWREVDKVHERGTFRALAWLTERIRNIDGQFADWQVVDHEHKKAIACHRCAPVSPAIRWTKEEKGRL